MVSKAARMWVSARARSHERASAGRDLKMRYRAVSVAVCAVVLIAGTSALSANAPNDATSPKHQPPKTTQSAKVAACLLILLGFYIIYRT